MSALSGAREANPRTGRHPGFTRLETSVLGHSSNALPVAPWKAEDFPWQTRDLLRLAWLTIIGAIGLSVSWYGCSGQANFHSQILWLATGIGALAIAGFGAFSWILVGVREVHREMRDLMNVIRMGVPDQTIAEPVHPGNAGTVAGEVAVEPGYVIGASMTRAHRSDCPLVHGKSVAPISDADIGRLGLAKCGVCAQ